MKYKKIYGKTYEDCMMQARMNLGPDAIPVSKDVENVPGLMNTLKRKKQVIVVFRIPEKSDSGNASKDLKQKVLSRVIDDKSREVFAGDEERGKRTASRPGQEKSGRENRQDSEVLARLYGGEDNDYPISRAFGKRTQERQSEPPSGSELSRSAERSQNPEKRMDMSSEKSIPDAYRKLRENSRYEDLEDIDKLSRPELAKNQKSLADDELGLGSLSSGSGDQKSGTASSNELHRKSEAERVEALVEMARQTEFTSKKSATSRNSFVDKNEDGSGMKDAEKLSASKPTAASSALTKSPANEPSRNKILTIDLPQDSPTDFSVPVRGLSRQGGDNINQLGNQLLIQELSGNFINQFISTLSDKLSAEQKAKREEVDSVSLKHLAHQIQADCEIYRGGKQKAIMLIGPTGVGKTTTMAKLAAIYSMQKEVDVSLVTIDNYRLAATEQMKKYADIIGIPLYVCRTPSEFHQKMQEIDSDLVFIDTSGRSQNNEDKIRELKSFCDKCPIPLEKHLVLSAITKNAILERIIKAYETLNFDRIILTKLDECEIIGSFVEMADKYNKPFSFLTNGQDVPNDIIMAKGEDMAKIILQPENQPWIKHQT